VSTGSRSAAGCALRRAGTDTTSELMVSDDLTLDPAIGRSPADTA
jgi:hypothetical protein